MSKHAYEDLDALVRLVETESCCQVSAFYPSNTWEYELKHHPEHFRRNDDGELLWLGVKVVVIGDDKNFLALADKIIPEENRNV